nr:uncharacterized protein LOC114924390 [Arachis hypogaea]
MVKEKPRLAWAANREARSTCLDGLDNYDYGAYQWTVQLVTNDSRLENILFPILWGLMTLRFDQCSISLLSLKGVKDAGYEKMTIVQAATLPVRMSLPRLEQALGKQLPFCFHQLKLLQIHHQLNVIIGGHQFMCLSYVQLKSLQVKRLQKLLNCLSIILPLVFRL